MAESSSDVKSEDLRGVSSSDKESCSVYETCENLDSLKLKPENKVTVSNNQTSKPDTETEEKKAEEKTLTDHLNKKLLGSFLERLNQNDNSLAFAFNRNNSSDDLDADKFSDGEKVMEEENALE